MVAACRDCRDPVNPPRTLLDKIWTTHLVRDLGGGVSPARHRPHLPARAHRLDRAQEPAAAGPRGRRSGPGVLHDGPHRRHPPGTRRRHADAGRPGVHHRDPRGGGARPGIRLFDVRDPHQGIVHVISPELGIVLPGVTVVCPDSHTCTQGGDGRARLGHRLDRGRARAGDGHAARARGRRRCGSGSRARLPPGVDGQGPDPAPDRRHGAAGGNGYAIEYAGSAVRALDVEARLTLCNMAIEFSALTGTDRAGRHDLRVPGRAGRSRRGRATGTRRSRTGARCVTRRRRPLRPRDRDRRRRAGADGHLGHQPAARGAASTAGCRTLERRAARPREAYDRALAVHGPRARARRSSDCRSARRSSAPAPTAASPTCARGGDAARPARRARASARSACRARCR